MNRKSHSFTDCDHAHALLKELNLQREMGQFCDCVIQLHINPGKLFLAHKNVLAASSPVFASILPSHGSMLDLEHPCLSSETLNFLLDYIYMGTLPPQSHEDLVLSAAIHFQMEDLQQALTYRQNTFSETKEADTSEPNKKRKLIEGNPFSSSFYPHNKPVSSCSSCEAVPVICHASAAGHNTFQLQPQTYSKDSGQNVDLELCEILPNTQEKKHWNEEVFVEAQPNEREIQSVISNTLVDEFPTGFSEEHRCHHYENSIGLKADRSQTKPVENLRTSATLNTKNDDGNQAFKYVTDNGNTGTLNHGELNKQENFVNFTLEAFDIKNTCNADNSSVEDEKCHLFRDFCSEDRTEIPGPLHLSETDANCAETNELIHKNSASGSNPWNELAHTKGQKSSYEHTNVETSTAVKIGSKSSEPLHIKNDHEEMYDISGQMKYDTSTYHGQLKYHYLSTESHCIADSSDSDDSRTYTVVTANPYIKDFSYETEMTYTTKLDIPAKQTAGMSNDLSASQQRVNIATMVTQPYQCSMCERAFSQRGSLNRHMRSHLGVRPYSCPQCPMTFSRQYRVIEHMRVHQRSCEELQRTGPLRQYTKLQIP